MSPFPVQPLSSMSLLVRGLVLRMVPSARRRSASSSLKALDLRASLSIMDTYHEAGRALETREEALKFLSNQDFGKAKPLTDLDLPVGDGDKHAAQDQDQTKEVAQPSLFNILPTEIREKIIEHAVDNHYDAYGPRVQIINENGGNSLRRLPAVAHVSHHFRKEALRHIIVAALSPVGATNGTTNGTANSVTTVNTVVQPWRDYVFLTDLAPNEYPESSKTIMKFAQNVMINFEAVVPEDPVDSGLFTEVMLSGTVFKDLKTLNVFVPTRFSNDVVEVNLNRQAFGALMNSAAIKELVRRPIQLTQRRVNLFTKTVHVYRRVGREFYLPLPDTQKWEDLLAVVRSLAIGYLKAESFDSHYWFQRDNSQLAWDESAEPTIREHLATTKQILWDCLEHMSQADGSPLQTRAAFDRDMYHRTPTIQCIVKIAIVQQKWEANEPINGPEATMELEAYNAVMRRTGRPQL